MSDTPTTTRPGARPARAALLAVVAALVLLVAGACTVSGQATSTPPASSAVPPSAAAPPAGGATPPAGSATTSASAGGISGVAGVFPDASGSGCRASGSQDRLTTSSGADPVSATICDYSSVAPGAKVIFAQWADVAAARSYYDDTENLGPRIEDFSTWQVGGAEQGPLYTARTGNMVISTGLYTGLPYSWEIRTSTLDQSNTIFNQIRFRARTELGG